MELSFQLVVESPQGRELDPVFTRHWSAYQRWIARGPATPFAECHAQLRAHMPELMPTFEKLHARLGGSDDAGRLLTLYNPPRVVRACTQLMFEASNGPTLMRSYDHDPRLLDGVVLRSEWDGVPVLAVTDCLWGALDGVNKHGLVTALAFGGRNVVGNGFGAPLICRYILQTCATVAEAREALGRLPVYMPYTFAVLDAAGDFVTAFLGPDSDPVFVTRRTSTNHQRVVEWPEYARFVETTERLACVENLMESTTSADSVRQVFLSPPVWRTHYAKGSGTLYVAEYSSNAKTLDLHWPGRTERVQLNERAGRMFSGHLPAEPAMRDSTAPSTRA